LAAIPPVGETIRVGGQPFEIVGVMEEKVQLSNYNRPGQVLRLHPVDDDGRPVRQPLRLDVRVAGGVADARAEGAAAGARLLAKRYRYNPADERALNMFGSEKTQEITAASSWG
jgi:hypothetical protein